MKSRTHRTELSKCPRCSEYSGVEMIESFYKDNNSFLDKILPWRDSQIDTFVYDVCNDCGHEFNVEEIENDE